MIGTFDFFCQECGSKFEITFVNGSSEAPACTVCGSIDVEKLFSPPTAVGIGGEKSSPMAELYVHPDKPSNPAKGWNKFAHQCQKAEDEGKTKKIDDDIGASVKVWKDAGYST